MGCLTKVFPETSFGGFSNVDGTVIFYLRVSALIAPTNVVLDIGCGRGAYAEDPVAMRRDLHILRGKVHKVIGLDLDASAAKNPCIDEFHLLESASARWPVPERSVDLAVADWSLEHVADPELFFSEVSRALKPGGYFCARTTNSWGYIAVAARLIPEKVHGAIIQKMQGKRPEQDIFPTLYACNSMPLLKRKLREHGLRGVVLGHAGLPGYLHFSCFLSYLGHFYERFVPQFLRHSLMVFAVKE